MQVSFHRIQFKIILVRKAKSNFGKTKTVYFTSSLPAFFFIQSIPEITEYQSVHV